MKKLGVFFTCYDELEATRYSLHILKLVYPEIPIYLVYEGNLDFTMLAAQFSNLSVNKVEDTMTDAFGITINNFRSLEKHVAMKRAVNAVINRLVSAADYLNSEYILMLDPDAVVRGHLNIPDGVGLLGCRINSNAPLLAPMNAVLKKYGGREITAWGATPAIFNVKKFLTAKKILFSHVTLMDELCESFYAMFAHDVLMPVLFSLIGEEENFNPDIVQITTNPNWQRINAPLVHQFRTYYPKRTTKYAAGNW